MTKQERQSRCCGGGGGAANARAAARDPSPSLSDKKVVTIQNGRHLRDPTGQCSLVSNFFENLRNFLPMSRPSTQLVKWDYECCSTIIIYLKIQNLYQEVKKNYCVYVCIQNTSRMRFQNMTNYIVFIIKSTQRTFKINEIINFFPV